MIVTNEQTGSILEVNRTMITWNAGKQWSILSPPYKKNSDGEWSKSSYSIGEQLNLHLEKTETSAGYHAPSIQTKESSPGYIIGMSRYILVDIYIFIYVKHMAQLVVHWSTTLQNFDFIFPTTREKLGKRH